MAEEVFNVVIVNRRFVLFKKKVSVQAPFRHWYRFKSIGLAPASERKPNDIHPYRHGSPVTIDTHA